MKLVDLLDGLTTVPLDKNKSIKGLALDSRELEQDFAFIAIAGTTQNGLEYIQQAKQKGVCVIIFDPLHSHTFVMDEAGIKFIAVENLTDKLGIMAERFYLSPSKKLSVIGITGTNGKTSCSQFLAQIIPHCGVIGTLGWGENNLLNKTLNTTPEALSVQRILANFVQQEKTTAVMEVSSHGLKQGRVNSVHFTGAIFTNLSQDHLDYHGSMQAYLEAKLILFKQANLQFVIVNADDKNSKKMLAVVNKHAKKWAFSTTGTQLKSTENLLAKNIVINLTGIHFLACWQGNEVLVNSHIVGRFNVENILTVMTGLLATGYSLQHAADKMSTLQAVSGRMECFGGNNKPFVFVDYAHTPDALEKVLQEFKHYKQEKLHVVFGCGGNRDKGKRQQMGEIANNFADEVTVTDDNPRYENSNHIIDDILLADNQQRFEIIQNREQAIRSVISRANKNDCIIVAGKGHEDYQDIQGVKHPFSDQRIVKHALSEWRA